jgi:hypothetical protein
MLCSALGALGLPSSFSSTPLGLREAARALPWRSAGGLTGGAQEGRAGGLEDRDLAAAAAALPGCGAGSGGTGWPGWTGPGRIYVHQLSVSRVRFRGRGRTGRAEPSGVACGGGSWLAWHEACTAPRTLSCTRTTCTIPPRITRPTPGPCLPRLDGPSRTGRVRADA